MRLKPRYCVSRSTTGLDVRLGEHAFSSMMQLQTAAHLGMGALLRRQFEGQVGGGTGLGRGWGRDGVYCARSERRSHLVGSIVLPSESRKVAPDRVNYKGLPQTGAISKKKATAAKTRRRHLFPHERR